MKAVIWLLLFLCMCISYIAYPNHTHHTPISHTSLVGLMPLCENMPSGTAVKPGDVVYAMNGKSVEKHRVCVCVCVCVYVCLSVSDLHCAFNLYELKCFLRFHPFNAHPMCRLTILMQREGSFWQTPYVTPTPLTPGPLLIWLHSQGPLMLPLATELLVCSQTPSYYGNSCTRFVGLTIA